MFGLSQGCFATSRNSHRLDIPERRLAPTGDSMHACNAPTGDSVRSFMPRNQRANSRSEFEHVGKFRIIRRDQAGVFESRALAETNGEDRRGVADRCKASTRTRSDEPNPLPCSLRSTANLPINTTGTSSPSQRNWFLFRHVFLGKVTDEAQQIANLGWS